MAYQRTKNEPNKDLQPACIHLRNKAIYVTGKLDRSHLNEISADEVGCWCNKTQHQIGPDEIQVDRETCVCGRECYRDC